MLIQYIFHTNGITMMNIEEFVSVARQLNFSMFLWNGDIYRVPDNPNDDVFGQPLRIKLSDID